MVPQTMVVQMFEWQTPGHPTLHAWHVTEYRPGERVVLERNPYYWKVDTEGNQLPYIDCIESIEIPDLEVRVLKMIGGEVDMAFRSLGSPRNLPVLLDNAERGGYRYLEGWINGTGGWPTAMVNQDFVGDDYIHSVLRDKNFRRDLSHAINREEINDAIWFGLGERLQQTTITEESWHFDSPEGRQVFEAWAASYADYDVELANEYLDAAGLDQRNAQGWRLRVDNGQPFELIIDIGDWGGDVTVNQESAALLQRHWQAVGVRVILNDAPPAEIVQRFNQAHYMVRMAHSAEMDLWTFPDWIFATGNNTRAWPLQQEWIRTGGMRGEEPGPIVQRLNQLYAEGIAIPNIEDRDPIVWEAIRVHIEEGPFYIGTVGGLPMPAFARENLRNIPNFGILGPWAIGSPGNTNPEQYFFKQ